MKNIVLYIIATLIMCNIMFQEVSAQKPSVGLLPYPIQQFHTVAATDSVRAEHNTVTPDTIVIADSLLPEVPDILEVTREEKRRWFSLESLLPKRRSIHGKSEKSSRTYPLVLKYINPVRLFLHITALK